MKIKKGFTIIESLVAISILIAAVVGATTAVQSGISSYIFSKDQIIAFYLAQEGFEQIRNIRDENRLNNRNWLAGIAENSGDPCYFGSACTVDPIASSAASRCTSGPGNCPVLKQDATLGFFGYNAAWPATIFKREITLTSINSDEVAVTVTVNWAKGGSSRQFKARENLLNW
ncbi:MAG: hypothetical protein AAB641_02285 [Patescibacteria group bacterium]